jgi:outer membrane murein-binding lipoprotein Lpp
MKKCILIFAAVGILNGCTSDDINNNRKSEEISNQISSMQNQINQLQNDLSQLSSQVSQLNKNYAVFTPGSNGYSTIYSAAGYFIVSLVSLKKYANGYRATFDIGNPNLITFNGIKLKVVWGEVYSNDKNYINWVNSLKTEEIEINKPLIPGVWNKITVVLSPATANETGFISLSVITNQVYLNRDLRNYS